MSVFKPCYVMYFDDVPEEYKGYLKVTHKGLQGSFFEHFAHHISGYVADVDATHASGDYDEYGEDAKEQYDYICSKKLDEWLMSLGIPDNQLVFFTDFRCVNEVLAIPLKPIELT